MILMTGHDESAAAFRAARDLLLRHRGDYAAASAEFAWPQLAEFNWALDWFDVIAAEHPERDALHITGGPAAARLSYGELAVRSSQVANWLRGHGACRGDRLLLMLGNIAPLWEVILAAIKLGVVIIPASTLLGPGDLADRVARGEEPFPDGTLASRLKPFPSTVSCDIFFRDRQQLTRNLLFRLFQQPVWSARGFAFRRNVRVSQSAKQEFCMVALNRSAESTKRGPRWMVSMRRWCSALLGTAQPLSCSTMRTIARGSLRIADVLSSSAVKSFCQTRASIPSRMVADTGGASPVAITTPRSAFSAGVKATNRGAQHLPVEAAEDELEHLGMFRDSPIAGVVHDVFLVKHIAGREAEVRIHRVRRSRF